MNILINAVSIKEGGSKVVLIRLLEEFIRSRPQYRWHVAVHPSMVPSLPTDPAVMPWPVVAATHSHIALRLWYEFELPRWILEHRIDLVFSQVYLPSRRLQCPTLILVQHAGHFSNVFRSLMASETRGPVGRLKFYLTGRWIRNSVAIATRVTVQTATLATAITRDVDVPPGRISVIPHGPGLVANRGPHLFPLHKPWRIGYVTKVGVQKDFQTLFRAMALLRECYPVELILTLDEKELACQKVIALAAELGIGDIVRNHGELAGEDIQRLYDSLDLFVFPSLCESFGFPLVEAMASGLPVIAADIDSTAEIGGGGVEYFQPRDAAALARHIDRLIKEPTHYNACAARAVERARHYSWVNSAEQNLALMEQMLGLHAVNPLLNTADSVAAHL